MAIGYHWHPAGLIRTARASLTAGRRVDAPPLGRGEHPLLRETGADEIRHVATERALYSSAAGTPDGWRRIAWIDVAAVGYAPGTGTLSLRSWPETGTRANMRVRDRSRLPAFALERVTACRIIHRRVRITGDRFITITAHREAGTDTTTWTVRTDPGCPGDDPAVALAIERAVQEMRALTGC